MLGTVEISIEGPDGPHVLGRVGAGEIFGEMGLITDRPRSATARAIEGTTVESIDEGIFEQSILRHPDRLRTYLTTLFDRLRSTDTLLQRELAQRAAVSKGDTLHAATSKARSHHRTNCAPPCRIRLRPANLAAGHREEAEVTELPFRIGRAFGDAGVALFAKNDLSITDEPPYHISRNHCEIDVDRDGVVLRDRGSTLGTIVNGAAIGIHEGTIQAVLKQGENAVILGSEDSCHRLLITLG